MDRIEDRPTTEPRTDAGRAVVEATASDPFIPDEQKPALRAAALRTVLAIEAEAAQGAAPLKGRWVDGYVDEFGDERQEHRCVLNRNALIDALIGAELADESVADAVAAELADAYEEATRD